MKADPTLTVRQTRAITALLEGATQDQAGRRAGVSERTIRTWSNTPAFADELARQRSRVLGAMATDLTAISRRAIRVLGEMVDGTVTQNNARRAACCNVIEFAVAFDELSGMERRVSELEKAWKLSLVSSPSGRPS